METNYDLAARIRLCSTCKPMLDLRMADGTYAVPAEVGVDAPEHPLGIVCEAPGAQEAATSRPLVGPAGSIFNELLAEAGIRREELILMNRVRCRPPGNKLSAVPEAVGNCDHWMQEELMAYDPAVVVVMGGTALQAIFGATAKVGATRGQCRTTNGRTYLATYHPASLLPYRGPQNIPLVVGDLRRAMEIRKAITA